MLFSHLDEVCISSFGSKRDPGFRTIVFQGAPFVGTEEWLRNLSRDPQQGFAAVQVETLATAHALYSDKTTLQKLREAEFDVILRDPFNWAAGILDDVLENPQHRIWSRLDTKHDILAEQSQLLTGHWSFVVLCRPISSL
ncbi:hypothetical protein WJX82_010562 [Trebouxia sp. C0006]